MHVELVSHFIYLGAVIFVYRAIDKDWYGSKRLLLFFPSLIQTKQVDYKISGGIKV